MVPISASRLTTIIVHQRLSVASINGIADFVVADYADRVSSKYVKGWGGEGVFHSGSIFLGQVWDGYSAEVPAHGINLPVHVPSCMNGVVRPGLGRSISLNHQRCLLPVSRRGR